MPNERYSHAALNRGAGGLLPLKGLFLVEVGSLRAPAVLFQPSRFFSEEVACPHPQPSAGNPPVSSSRPSAALHFVPFGVFGLLWLAMRISFLSPGGPGGSDRGRWGGRRDDWTLTRTGTLGPPCPQPWTYRWLCLARRLRLGTWGLPSSSLQVAAGRPTLWFYLRQLIRDFACFMRVYGNTSFILRMEHGRVWFVLVSSTYVHGA